MLKNHQIKLLLLAILLSGCSCEYSESFAWSFPTHDFKMGSNMGEEMHPDGPIATPTPECYIK